MVRTVDYDNSKDSSEQKVTFSGSTSVQTTKSWSWSAGIEAGVSATVSAGIPSIGEASVTASLTVSASTTHQNAIMETTEQSYSLSITVPPFTKIKASAILYKGAVNLKYTGKMLCVLETDREFSYAVSGN